MAIELTGTREANEDDVKGRADTGALDSDVAWPQREQLLQSAALT